MRGVDDWRADRQKMKLDLKLFETRKKEPKMEICEYFRAFENLAYLREPSLLKNGEPDRDEEEEEICKVEK